MNNVFQQRHRRRDGRSLLAEKLSPLTTYGASIPRRSKVPNARRASADPFASVFAMRNLSMQLLPMSSHFLFTMASILALMLAGVAPANDSEIEASTARGLDWLESTQQPDGSWGSAAFRGSAAVTATCTMAMVGSGNTPTEGPRARAVARAVAFLLASAGGSGLIAGREQAAHGPMYGHAFATIALAELYGETDDDAAVADALDGARRLIERTQNKEGGWRYQPVPRDADISVTAAMLNALRALRNAGFDVSAEAVDRAVAYLGRLQNADGGFRYQSSAGPPRARPRRSSRSWRPAAARRSRCGAALIGSRPIQSSWARRSSSSQATDMRFTVSLPRRPRSGSGEMPTGRPGIPQRRRRSSPRSATTAHGRIHPAPNMARARR